MTSATTRRTGIMKSTMVKTTKHGSGFSEARGLNSARFPENKQD
jgi:hypothetical protein